MGPARLRPPHGVVPSGLRNPSVQAVVSGSLPTVDLSALRILVDALVSTCTPSRVHAGTRGELRLVYEPWGARYLQTTETRSTNG